MSKEFIFSDLNNLEVVTTTSDKYATAFGFTEEAIWSLLLMNAYMKRVILHTFSYFDTGRNASQEESERFYHGFVLGLIAELDRDYVITSNRGSGFGRYDVMIEPKDKSGDGGSAIPDSSSSGGTTVL